MLEYAVMPLYMRFLALNPALTPAQAQAIESSITQYATTYDLDRRLVAAVIAVESRFDQSALGPKGEIGLMQLRPIYHLKDTPSQLFNIDANIRTGVKYLSGLKAVFSHYPGYGWVEHYNRGPNAKRPRVFAYTKRVLSYYKLFGGVIDDSTSPDPSPKRRHSYARRSYSSREAAK